MKDQSDLGEFLALGLDDERAERGRGLHASIAGDDREGPTSGREPVEDQVSAPAVGNAEQRAHSVGTFMSRACSSASRYSSQIRLRSTLMRASTAAISLRRTDAR